MKLIKRIVVDKVPVGMYLVIFDAIWGSYCNPGEHDDCLEHGCPDREPEYIAEIEPCITEVTKDNYLTLTEDVVNKNDTWNAKKLFETA